MNNETLGLALTALGMAAGLIWFIIRMATKPLVPEYPEPPKPEV